MSRTDLDAETLARSLRAMAGDGGIEWVMEPMQASVLLDIADALDENARLREQVADACIQLGGAWARCTELREMVRDVYKAAHMLCEAWDGSCSKEADGMSLHSVCPIGDTSELCVFGKLDDRMRELGLEVDG